MTAHELYNFITKLLEDGATVKDLAKFNWGKSYVYSIQNIGNYPQVIKAMEMNEIHSISTAAKLAENLSGKEINDSGLIKRAIKKVNDGSWAVKDIGRHLAQEKEFLNRVPVQPELDQELIEASGPKRAQFVSKWQPTWDRLKLQAEKRRFEAELEELKKAINRK